MNLRLLLLTLCQGLFLTNNVTFIAINRPGLGRASRPTAGRPACHGLRRRRARPARAWARAASACRAAAGIPGGSRVRRRRPRVRVRGAFDGSGCWSPRPCWPATTTRLYRFAATEIVAPAFKERAISWVRARSLAPGPTLAERRARRGRCPSRAPTRRWSASRCRAADDLGDRLSAAAAAEAARWAGRCARLRASRCSSSRRAPSCALAYGVMNLLMAATPIAMAQRRHPFASAALVLEWDGRSDGPVPSFTARSSGASAACR